ncbi:hypothetical protein E4U47_003991 [Claviceps purpurea]|nr:hypothetical protein E4U47_003991 [Claviceps purpurea]
MTRENQRERRRPLFAGLVELGNVSGQPREMISVPATRREEPKKQTYKFIGQGRDVRLPRPRDTIGGIHTDAPEINIHDSMIPESMGMDKFGPTCHASFWNIRPGPDYGSTCSGSSCRTPGNSNVIVRSLALFWPLALPPYA